LVTWEKSDDSESLSQQVGEYIHDRRPDDIFRLHQLILYLFCMGKLDAEDKIALDFYVDVYGSFSKKKETKIFDAFIIDALKQAFNIGFTSVAAVTTYLSLFPDTNPFYKIVITGLSAAFAELFILYLKSLKKIKPVTFSEFKSDFIKYALKLKTERGEKFIKKYSDFYADFEKRSKSSKEKGNL